MPRVRPLLSPRFLVVSSTVAVLGWLVVVPGVAAADPAGAGERVVGQIVQAWPEQGNAVGAVLGNGTEPLTWVESADGTSVRVPTGDLTDVPLAEAGATVAVTLGDHVVDEAAAGGALQPAREVLQATVVAPAPTEQLPVSAAGAVTDEVTVVMAVPRGGTADDLSLQQVVDTVNGSVSAYWSGQTEGAVRVAVRAAVDLRAAPTAAGCAEPAALWDEIGARVGWARSPGQHLLVYLPATSTDCAFGLAEVGATRSSGGRLYVRSAAPAVIAHELGHNYSLGHSSEVQCDGQVETGSCQVTPYNDWYDVMGVSWNEIGSLNAPQAARIGVLPAAQRVDVDQSSGSAAVDLAPMSSPSGVRAVRITDGTGTVYWLEYRAATGQDAWLSVPARNWPGLQAGVTLRRSADGADTALLMDPTPSGAVRWSGDRQVAIPVGTSLALAGGRFTVTVEAVGGVARVRVDAGTPPVVVPVVTVPVVTDPGGIGGSGSAYFLNDAFTGSANTAFRFGDDGDTVYAGDWDGNGTDTLAVRRGIVFYLRNSNTSGPADTTFAYGDPGDTVLFGDWDGNGTDTPAVRRGNTFFLKNDTSSGVADTVLSYGDPGDVVLVGDWNGDGRDTLMVRRGSRYFVKNDMRSGVADQVIDYGDPGDSVLVGRWTAGGATTLAVRRGNTYFLRYSLTTGVADLVFGYGEPADTAFVGDWNGDGVDGLGVRRAAG